MQGNNNVESKTYMDTFYIALYFFSFFMNLSYSQEFQNPGLLFEYDLTYTGTAVPKSYELERNYITMTREISSTRYRSMRICIEFDSAVERSGCSRNCYTGKATGIGRCDGGR